MSGTQAERVIRIRLLYYRRNSYFRDIGAQDVPVIPAILLQLAIRYLLPARLFS